MHRSSYGSDHPTGCPCVIKQKKTIMVCVS